MSGRTNSGVASAVATERRQREIGAQIAALGLPLPGARDGLVVDLASPGQVGAVQLRRVGMTAAARVAAPGMPLDQTAVSSRLPGVRGRARQPQGSGHRR